MATPAIRMLRRLEGLFCVYKPSGVHWKLVRDTVETNILKGEGDPLRQRHSANRETHLLFCVHHNIIYQYNILIRALYSVDLLCPRIDLNAAPSQPLPRNICFLTQADSKTEASGGLTLRTASLPVLSKHPLGMFIQLF